MHRHMGCNHSHSHSHCSREPLLALRRAARGRDRDLLRVQLPSRRHDHHGANRYPHHASHCRSNYPHRHASRHHHHRVHRHDGRRMTEPPNLPIAQWPLSELPTFWSCASSQRCLERERAGLLPNSLSLSPGPVMSRQQRCAMRYPEVRTNPDLGTSEGCHHRTPPDPHLQGFFAAKCGGPKAPC